MLSTGFLRNSRTNAAFFMIDQRSDFDTATCAPRIRCQVKPVGDFLGIRRVIPA
jgi:hypothetical protein